MNENTTPVAEPTEAKHYAIAFDDEGNPVKVEIDAEGNAKDVDEDVKVN